MTFASPFPDVAIPEVDVYEYLFGDLPDADAGRVALVDAVSGNEMTYRDLVTRIDAFAAGLAASGVRFGDVVGLLAPNSAEFAIAFHGILRAGATATTINTLFTAKDVARQLSNSRAKMLIAASSLHEVASEGAVQAGLSANDVTLLGQRIGAPAPSAQQLYIDDSHPAGMHVPSVTFDPATHLAVLPYSSGTTGAPKGVMLTHRNLTANIAQIRPIQGITCDDVIIAVLPFFHAYGMTVLLNAALHARAKLVIMPSFNLDGFLAAIQNYRCTVGYIAPPVAVAVAKQPEVDRFNLSSLRTVMSGAAPLDAEVAHTVAKRLGCKLVQGYGMSELSPVSHCMPFHDGIATRSGEAPLSSCGWTVPNGVSKIVDPVTGSEIDVPATGLSRPGELWFAGPNVMAGYLDNDAATAETVDSEGFLHTGDLACVDSNGCVYIVDRLKELIKYKGYQVPPAELEALLLSHPGIADAAVVGVTTADGEEIPKAFVVTQAHADLDAEHIIDFIAGQVAPYKKIRQVEFIDVIPKSAAGKILRMDLRNR